MGERRMQKAVKQGSNSRLAEYKYLQSDNEALREEGRALQAELDELRPQKGTILSSVDERLPIPLDKEITMTTAEKKPRGFA